MQTRCGGVAWFCHVLLDNFLNHSAEISWGLIWYMDADKKGHVINVSQTISKVMQSHRCQNIRKEHERLQAQIKSRQQGDREAFKTLGFLQI